MNNRYYWGLRFESLRSFELNSSVFLWLSTLSYSISPETLPFLAIAGILIASRKQLFCPQGI